MPDFDVEVTLQDIADGEGREGVFDSCPVAISLMRLGCQKIDVDEDRILITYNEKRYVYKTPRAANLFIGDFDCGRKIKPIKFKLEKPQLATIKDERAPMFRTSREEEEEHDSK